ncbi:MAG: hypothetical protein IBJ18_00065 [Phycisphaerales bacterium]|nr:hypothetical protein [Phycisphaerales bacterium]
MTAPDPTSPQSALDASRSTRRARAFGLAALAAGLLISLSGCNLVAPIGGVMENIKRDTPVEVLAEYEGLSGKSFAVVVLADRVIQAEYPEVVARLTIEIAERLKKETTATAYVPGKRMLQYQFDNPRWISMSAGDLGKALGVERLVYVELLDYRLNDPGNAYLWKGVARANVSVAEIDGSAPDDLRLRKPLAVRYPDDDGYGQQDMQRVLVNTELSRRMIDRVSWLFYKHEEKYDSKY